MSSSISAPALSSQRPAAHRRIQSQQVSPGGFQNSYAPPAPAPVGSYVGGGMGLDQASLPRGHGRRHSVNVLNKGHNSQPSQFFSYNGVDGFDDGFQPPANAPPVPTQHNRNASRTADSSWRISKLLRRLHSLSLIFLSRRRSRCYSSCQRLPSRSRPGSGPTPKSRPISCSFWWPSRQDAIL